MAKAICDVHLPRVLVHFLNTRGIETIHVNDLPEKWFTTDAAICQFADERQMLVITKDSDFRNSHFLNHQPRKLLHVVTGNTSNKELIELFEIHLKAILDCCKTPMVFIELSGIGISVTD